jgi:hypothetical protein
MYNYSKPEANECSQYDAACAQLQITELECNYSIQRIGGLTLANPI